MTIIKIKSEWNNGHCSLDNVDYILHGWTELPIEFTDTWSEHKPFVDITVDENNNIVSMVGVDEIIAEDMQEDTNEPDVWDELASAITEGVNEI